MTAADEDPDGVTEDGCEGKDDGTLCIHCQNAVGKVKIPDSTGGPGLHPIDMYYNCSNLPRKPGECQDGECELQQTFQFLCSETVHKHVIQNSPVDP